MTCKCPSCSASFDVPVAKLCWVAFHVDWSAFAIFNGDDELGALRYAVENHMEAMQVPTGVSVHEYVSAEWTNRARNAIKEDTF